MRGAKGAWGGNRQGGSNLRSTTPSSYQVAGLPNWLFGFGV